MIEVTCAGLKSCATALKAGDNILLSGAIFTARDQAHLRIVNLLKKDLPLPFSIENSVIYYTGPTPAPSNKIIGSCGPTTSKRMDKFAPVLYDLGLTATIGKGDRSPEVLRAIKRNGGLYLAAIGGAGALYAERVKFVKTIAFEDLGTESVKQIEVENFALIVAIDSNGNSIYKN